MTKHNKDQFNDTTTIKTPENGQIPEICKKNDKANLLVKIRYIEQKWEKALVFGEKSAFPIKKRISSAPKR